MQDEEYQAVWMGLGTIYGDGLGRDTEQCLCKRCVWCVCVCVVCVVCVCMWVKEGNAEQGGRT